MNAPLPEPEAMTEPTADAEALWRRIVWSGQRHPTEDLQHAQSLRESLTPILLRTIQEVIADPKRFAAEQDFHGAAFAFLLLAQFREPRAFPLAIQFLHLDDELVDDLVGEMITDDFPAILASTYNGDLDALKRLYEEENLDEFFRIAGLGAIGALVHQGRLARSELSHYVGEVMGRLDREPSWVWTQMVMAAADFQLAEHREAILALYDEGLTDESVDPKADVEAHFQGGMGERCMHDYRFIDDVSAETRGWACFDERVQIIDRCDHMDPDDPLIGEDTIDEGARPFVRESPKVGRNDPCPCGSGKKSKKCCGA